jgi:Flp pilus assembly protein TadB
MRLNEPPDIDEEVAEGYNLIIHRTPQPVQTFISKTADSLYHELLTAFDRLKSKEIDKKLLEKELGIAKKIMIFQRFMERYVEDAPTILTILFDMIPLAGGALGVIIYNHINTLLGLVSILIAIIAVIDIIVSIYYVLRKRKLLKISEEIEKFIEENILADVYRTIWSELRV